MHYITLHLHLHNHRKKTIPHKLQSKLWEIVHAGIFSIDNETLLWIADYYSKFPVMNRADRLSADDLIRAIKVLFTEFVLPKIVSDADRNFTSDWFKQFFRQLNTDQATISLHHHQRNGHVEVCINFVKHTIKML